MPNLTELLAADLAATGTRITHDAVIFGGGRAMAWRPPADLAPDHPAAAYASQLVTRIAGHGQERGKIAADPMRSDLAKAKDAEAVDQKAAAAVAAAIEQAEKWADAAEQNYAAALAPPVIRPEDAAGAIADQEVRTHLRGLSLSAAIPLVRDHPAVADAVLRSTLPQPEQLVAAARERRAELLLTTPNGLSIARGVEIGSWLRQVTRQGRFAFEQVVKPARPAIRSVA
jgi:hypothetical protein